MKRYDVYSIGTALIDLKFKLTENDQKNFALEHGGTKLLTADAEATLLKKLSHMHGTQACGGSGGNTTSLIQQLGGKTFYTCQVGEDDAGDFYYQDLKQQGIQTNLDSGKRAPNRTGKCIVFITSDADRTLHTFLGANQNLSPTDLNEAAIHDASYLFIESFLSITPSAKETALLAKKIAAQSGTKVALTLTTCVAPHFKPQDLHDMVGDGVDLLFCNEFEAGFLAGSHEMQSIEEKLKSIAKQFIITRGKNGALIYDGKKFIELKAKPVVAVDTTGAGDAFAGAFLYGITHGMDFERACELATELAGKLVTQFGPRLLRDTI